MREKIAQSSYLITYWHDKSTPDPIDVERKMTQQLCGSTGLVEIRFCNKGRRKLTVNIPCRSCAEVSLPASERLETMIAPHNSIKDATAFEKTRVCRKRTYSSLLCSDPELLWASSGLS